MKRTITIALILAACAFLISLIYVELPFSSPSGDSVANEQLLSASSTIQIKDRTIRVEIADTSGERERGLSGKEGLAEDEGMLFVFEEDGRPAFWMKDMLFAIDILWISSDGAIVHIEENVAPETYPTAFAPRNEARYVVELPAGYVAKYTVRPGDIVRL
ncbi:DUF192 domain-containing protein [Candidatus Kaiserbacteria bacterium]|nr:DUF192 domain-containing protein [Candidatus Kaiserbacteria bacterium]